MNYETMGRALRYVILTVNSKYQKVSSGTLTIFGHDFLSLICLAGTIIKEAFWPKLTASDWYINLWTSPKLVKQLKSTAQALKINHKKRAPMEENRANFFTKRASPKNCQEFYKNDRCLNLQLLFLPMTLTSTTYAIFKKSRCYSFILY